MLSCVTGKWFQISSGHGGWGGGNPYRQHDDLVSQLSFKEGKYVKTGMVVNKEHIARMYTFVSEYYLSPDNINVQDCVMTIVWGSFTATQMHKMKEMKMGEGKHFFWKQNTSVLCCS